MKKSNIYRRRIITTHILYLFQFCPYSGDHGELSRVQLTSRPDDRENQTCLSIFAFISCPSQPAGYYIIVRGVLVIKKIFIIRRSSYKDEKNGRKCGYAITCYIPNIRFSYSLISRQNVYIPTSLLGRRINNVFW